jgi:hypothetical protein
MCGYFDRPHQVCILILSCLGMPGLLTEWKSKVLDFVKLKIQALPMLAMLGLHPQFSFLVLTPYTFREISALFCYYVIA